MLEATPQQAQSPPRASPPSVRTAAVAAIIVSWNRKADVLRVLERLGVQARSCGALHVVVVENGSDDGTGDAVIAAHRPDHVVRNDNESALDAVFEPIEPALAQGGNTAGFASLTLVRNRHNLGGCGGFNTGLTLIEQRLGAPGSPSGPEFVWLLDDDIDLPPDALFELLSAAGSDPDIALVGSRTVDLGDRRTTIESTIFFDDARGMMTPEPPRDHPHRADHAAWMDADEAVRYTGIRDVDVVSACSMLVRWSAIEHVGFWDERFFIYCDDADWCLRVKRAGARVVCALDAVVYHTPWTHKLTPIRGYYLHRNLLWMVRKHLRGRSLRRVSLTWCGRLLKQARSAALNRRMTEAVLTLRSLTDAIRGTGGRLDAPSGRTQILDALDSCGASGGEAVVIVHDRAGFLNAENLRAAVTNRYIVSGRSGAQPRWRYLAEQGVPLVAHGGDAPETGDHRPEIVRYEPTRLGKLRAMRLFLRRRPDAVIVLDGACQFPLLLGDTTLHVTSDDMATCQTEPGGWRAVLRFGRSWVPAVLRSLWYGLTVTHDDRRDRDPSNEGRGS